jgi:hypothetical protein
MKNVYNLIISLICFAKRKNREKTCNIFFEFQPQKDQVSLIIAYAPTLQPVGTLNYSFAINYHHI